VAVLGFVVSGLAGLHGPAQGVAAPPTQAAANAIPSLLQFSGTLAAAPAQVPAQVPCDAVGTCRTHPIAAQGRGTLNVSAALTAAAVLPGPLAHGRGVAAPLARVDLEVRRAGTHATVAVAEQKGDRLWLNATLANGTYELFVQVVQGGPVGYNLTGLLHPVVQLLQDAGAQILAKVDVTAALGPLYLVAAIVGGAIVILLGAVVIAVLRR
jgi:hypothetical protein